MRLNFKKPVGLPLDRCSKLFFARHYDQLRPHWNDKEEPPDLGNYIDFLRKRGVN